jgi:hypothetical protein
MARTKLSAPSSRVKDLTGTRCGTLIVRTYITTKPTGNLGKLNVAQWECECETCGAIQVKSRRRLVDGTAKCDSCHRRVRRDLTGKRFGRWEVVALAPATGGESQWRCRCDCGTWRVMRRAYLTSGDSRSCGCYFEEVNPQVMRRARKARWSKRK